MAGRAGLGGHLQKAARRCRRCAVVGVSSLRRLRARSSCSVERLGDVGAERPSARPSLPALCCGFPRADECAVRASALSNAGPLPHCPVASGQAASPVPCAAPGSFGSKGSQPPPTCGCSRLALCARRRPSCCCAGYRWPCSRRCRDLEMDGQFFECWIDVPDPSNAPRRPRVSESRSRLRI